jgi:hypothetical protein
VVGWDGERGGGGLELIMNRCVRRYVGWCVGWLGAVHVSRWGVFWVGALHFRNGATKGQSSFDSMCGSGWGVEWTGC